MSENLKHWEALSHPPADALKKITGGRLNGMTDIKPQWRYLVMTQEFGPCGVGWKYTVTKQWLEPGDGDQTVAFVNIDLFVKNGDEWSDAIPGGGGSMFIANERNGKHTSDEAYKMATTDALSCAMKMLGVGAAVYLGEWNGSKYRNEPVALTRPAEEAKPAPAKTTQQDQPDGYLPIMKEGEKYISLVTNAAGANSMLQIINGYTHVGTSLADLKRALQARVEEVGAYYNVDHQQFEDK